MLKARALETREVGSYVDCNTSRDKKVLSVRVRVGDFEVFDKRRVSTCDLSEVYLCNWTRVT